MPRRLSNTPRDSQQLKRALSRWDNEGGAGSHRPATTPVEHEATMPTMGQAEIDLLHVRVIALENLVAALLAGATQQQIERAREMAPYILPREGFTRHPLTIQAAAHMVNLIERAARFRDGALPVRPLDRE